MVPFDTIPSSTLPRGSGSPTPSRPATPSRGSALDQPAKGPAPLCGALIVCAVFPASAGAVSFFRTDVTVGTHPTSVAVDNFNGGAPDLAVANEGSDTVSILLGNGFGQFTAASPVSVGDAPSSVVTGSFNGDAFTDLAIAGVGDDNIAIKLGDGTGGFNGTGTVSTGASSDPRAIAVIQLGGTPALQTPISTQ